MELLYSRVMASFAFFEDYWRLVAKLYVLPIVVSCALER